VVQHLHKALDSPPTPWGEEWGVQNLELDIRYFFRLTKFSDNFVKSTLILYFFIIKESFWLGPSGKK
jgi:hypothetical protein